MASFMPAACKPWAMDHAIERLLATPKTTALRPCKSEDMYAPYKGERITAGGGAGPRTSPIGEKPRPLNPLRDHPVGAVVHLKDIATSATTGCHSSSSS